MLNKSLRRIGFLSLFLFSSSVILQAQDFSNFGLRYAPSGKQLLSATKPSPHFTLGSPGIIQNREKSAFDMSRVVYGGNLGAFFGTITYVEVSPVIGYKVTDRFIPGIGVTYRYYRQRITPSMVYQTHLYGGSLFARFFVLDNVFLQGELEALNYAYYDAFLGETDRQWFGSYLVGGGYMSGGMSVSFLYALNSNTPASPYFGNPLIIRVGFMTN